MRSIKIYLLLFFAVIAVFIAIYALNPHYASWVSSGFAGACLAMRLSIKRFLAILAFIIAKSALFAIAPWSVIPATAVLLGWWSHELYHQELTR